MIVLKSAQEIDRMREAGRVTALTIERIVEEVRPGMSTADLDRIGERSIRSEGCTPSFLGYRGFPASICVSVNDEIVHGIPSPKRILREGDVLSIDVGAVYEGYHGDSAVTIPIGRVSPEVERLIDVTRDSLERGMAEMVPGKRLSDIGHAVQERVEAEGFSVVRQFVGHGIGREMHEPPQIPNYGPGGRGPRLKPGMVFAIEPMVTAGGPEVHMLDDQWTAVTADGSLAAHFEHTILVTDAGPEVLTRVAGSH